MEDRSADNISVEVLAAFLDGNATAQECREILGALADDAELRELMHISQSVDAQLGMTQDECDMIPMTAMAATASEGNYCALECEKHILRSLAIEFDESELLKNAIQNGWQKEEGTALHNVGRHLEEYGLVVSRRYNASIEDVAEALGGNRRVIVAVDGGELLGDMAEERNEDVVVGRIPDHTVVVLAVDMAGDAVTLYDPNSANMEDRYPIAQFMDAWQDSNNYLVTITSCDADIYVPRPVDLSDVELSDDLNDLREAIAENAHDVWAAERQAQGWTYGPQRDDERKQTPCMVAYSQLPDSEKQFDRDMAMNTIKLLKKLGYDIVKRSK